MCKDKAKIIEIFHQNVKGKIPDISNSNVKHDGKVGHWLEIQMGKTPDSDNNADFFGYELKNETTSGKISFGDWSADEYIFLHGRGNKPNSINKNYQLSRKEFMKIFGKKNPDKNSRYSWSGEPCPTYFGKISKYGQLLTIDSSENLIITYNYSKDTRTDKDKIVPQKLRQENLVIAKWKHSSIKNKLEKKFNQKGWFTCSTNQNGEYDKIHFGKAINYETWLQLVKDGTVFFDSGMYHDDDKPNIRPYSQWRATTSFWHSLIVESF